MQDLSASSIKFFDSSFQVQIQINNVVSPVRFGFVNSLKSINSLILLHNLGFNSIVKF